MYQNLNQILRNFHLKEIKTPTNNDNFASKKPCIVFFTVAEERISLLLAGNKILPKCVFIVTEPEWIVAKQENRKYVLYLLEGISSNEFGECFQIKFKNPIKITFLCNFYTEAALSIYDTCVKNKINQFQTYELLADCPMSSGSELEKYTNDKLHTRLLAAENQVPVPRTLAFCFSANKYKNYSPTSQVKLIQVSKKITDQEIRQYLAEFLAEEFVIKPSGHMWMGSKLVTIESKNNLDQAVENFKRCLNELDKNDSLLVEEFVNSKVSDLFSVGSRLRVYVTRRPNNSVETTGIICNLGNIDMPINGDTSESFSIDYLCDLLQVSPQEKEQIISQIKQLGKIVLEAIITYEEHYLQAFTGNKQTDFIGLDIGLKKITNNWELYLIEVNDHDCLNALQAYESQHAHQRTHLLDKWVETMLYRSYKYMLKEQNILMIGGGGYSKLNVFKFSQEAGINITLIDNNSSHFAIDYCTNFFQIDIDNHQQDLENALSIVEIINKNKIIVDGVITFWEDNAPLATLIANILQKSGNSYHSALIAKSKFLTHKKLLADEESKLYYESRQFSCGIESFVLNSINDIDNIPLDLYPLVIKFDTVSSAFGVEIISTQAELIDKFEEYKNFIQTSKHKGVGLGFKHRIIVMPFISGSEHDIDIIISDGKLIAGLVTDNGANSSKICRENTAIMPSLLSQEKQDNLIQAAWMSCQKIGLNNGVFNVEAIYTILGVKIIEINARMGGFYISRWLFNIWDINLILYSYLIVCGIQPFINKSLRPHGYYNGFLCYSSSHKQVIDKNMLAKIAQLPDFFICLLESEIPEPEKYEEPYASIATYAKDIELAQRNMTEFLLSLEQN